MDSTTIYLKHETDPDIGVLPPFGEHHDSSQFELYQRLRELAYKHSSLLLFDRIQLAIKKINH